MESAAEVLKDLPKDFHYAFDIVHFIVCIQGDRLDMGDRFLPTSKEHPLASWMSAMMACFAGGLLVSPLCGEPVLSAFNDVNKLLIASALWFLLYYSPQDIVYQVSKMFPVKVLLYLVKGLYYPKKVMAGMKHAKHILPGNFLALIIIACCKGNGSGILKPLCRLVRGVWTPLSSELLIPSLTTKYCIVACVLLTAFPGDLTYVAVAGLFLAMKVGPLFGVPVDLFTPLEQVASPWVFGTLEDENNKKEKKEN